MPDGADKDAIMVWSRCIQQAILGRHRRPCLQQFLQLALGVADVLAGIHLIQCHLELGEDKSAHLSEAPIEINGTDECLEGISQGGVAIAATACFLSAT